MYAGPDHPTDCYSDRRYPPKADRRRLLGQVLRAKARRSLLVVQFRSTAEDVLTTLAAKQLAVDLGNGAWRETTHGRARIWFFQFLPQESNLGNLLGRTSKNLEAPVDGEADGPDNSASAVPE